jgi:signal transduction histidine kinase
VLGEDGELPPEALIRLLEEQSTLRRIATLVATGAHPEEVFAAVAEEVGRLLPVVSTTMARFEPGPALTTLAAWSITGPPAPVGKRWPLTDVNVGWKVLQSGEAARTDDYSAATDPLSVSLREAGVKSVVGSPIVVEGRLWGVVTVRSNEGPLPPGTEERLSSFTGLVATAIANAEARAELVASRARIVAAGDEARRRIERNLHDGVQQRLLALRLDVQRARGELPEEQRDTRSTLLQVEQDLETILEDLRELSHGLHPPMLSRLGLGPSLQALARRLPIPVHLALDLRERPTASLETALYYAVSESLTNAVKHSHASALSVTITSGEKLQASIVDDGVGGADADGSGLVGLRDRVEALGGRFALDSPPSGGTKISIELPVEPTPAS